MNKLIHKELTLTYYKLFYFLPILLAALMFIPNWIFVLVFMYFIWVTVPQIYSRYQSTRDFDFVAMLPVRKQDIVVSKALSMIILELLHFLLGLIAALIHNLLYGPQNIFFDLNPAFFGYILVMFSIFNISFLPTYYKSAYYFGKPTIYGVVTTFLFIAAVELLNLFVAPINQVLEGSNSLVQYSLLLGMILISIVINFIAIKKSVTNFQNIQ